MQKKVAFQGSIGAYSSIAARAFFEARGEVISLVGLDTFRSTMDSVRDGDADFGMLPIENTTAGSILEVYDLLGEMDLPIIGEKVQRVEHCLITLHEMPLDNIKVVLSHPQALLQCSDFLRTLSGCKAVSFTDTAMSVEKILHDNDETQAAIASEQAASLHGLHIARKDIANQRENFTRFFVVAREAHVQEVGVACKVSIVFTTQNEAGALVQVLSVLADRGLNLTKLESRPKPHAPWEYMFYADFDGNIAEQNVQDALHGLSARTGFLKVLGCYPKAA